MPLGRIADYELLEELGGGQMGVVYKARHPRLDHFVAIKVLAPHLMSSREHRERFMREARAEAGLSHPSIARCFDVGEAPPIPPDLLDPGSAGPHPSQLLYLSMEYVPGTDLENLIDGTPLPLERVLDLTMQIAGALEAAHRAGIVHRDLKPTNVRVTPDGQVKVVDFGLARVLEPPPSADGSTQPVGLSSSGRVLGTAAYMSPEQAHGTDVDERSDLFSLGVILYRLVTSHLPFTGKTVLEIWYAAANVEPPPLARYASNVPDELERIVRKLLAKDPGRRYQSAHEVKTDLEHLRHHLHDEIHPHKLPLRPVAVAAGVMLVALLALLVWQRMASGSGQSLAILPFQNKTSDPGLDYLGEGIASQIIAKLVSQSRLNVASLESTTKLARTNATTSAVARELGVQAVLEGSTRRDDARDHAGVALVDGRRGYVRWMHRYDYSLANCSRSSTTSRIRSHMRLQGSPSAHRLRNRLQRECRRMPSVCALRQRSRSPATLRGRPRRRALISRRSNVTAAFALAWADRAGRCGRSGRVTRTLPLCEKRGSCRPRGTARLAAARSARRAGADLPSHEPLCADRFESSESVLAVNPNWDEALLQLGAAQREAGNLGRGRGTFRRAVEVRPTYWRNWNSLGGCYGRRGNYADAAGRLLAESRG
jgi:serine/threonine protein kinase